MTNRSLALGNNIAIVGRSTGGAPKTALSFSTPVQAQNTLVSGELLDAVLAAFAPSSETPGPQKVYAIRVNPATQSTLTLLDGDAGDSLVLTSSDYGQYTTGIKIKIEAGSSEGKKITTQLGTRYITKDNLARTAFTIQYTGVEASATMTVTPTAVTLKAPSNADGTVISLVTYPTVQELVDRINVEPGFVAVLESGTANTPALYGLDSMAAVDVRTASTPVTANLQAIIDWMNSFAEGYITVTRPVTAGKVPANIDFTFLAGGSDGTVQNSDWQDCFSVLQGADIQWISVLSSSSSIWDMADAHCIYMSEVGKSERRCFVGGAIGTSIDQACSDAMSLNSPRTVYCFPEFSAYNSRGVLTTYAPYMLTAYLAGAFAGVSPGGSMTNKSISIAGLPVAIKNPVDTDVLISSGVCTLHRTSGITRITKAVTTWTADTKYNKVEISTGVATDFTVKAVRQALTSLIGQKANSLLLARAVSLVDTTLKELSIPEPQGLGLLAGDTAHPAYKGIAASITGDVLKVSFSCSPVIPINYVLISVSINPYSGSLATDVE
jgi:hypothetical protein